MFQVDLLVGRFALFFVSFGVCQHRRSITPRQRMD